MKKNLMILLATLAFLSCEKKKDVQSVYLKDDLKEKTGDSITLEFFNIGDSIKNKIALKQYNSQESIAPANENIPNTIPFDLTKRDFLHNTVGYKTNLEQLVGKLVRRTMKDGKLVYVVTTDYKKDSVRLETKIPEKSNLIEKRYDSKVGAEVKYLFASVTGEANKAFSLLINDTAEVLIKDEQINKRKLYNRFKDDIRIAEYFVITAAVVTSIATKQYVKMSSKGGYNTGAIKVNADYYNEDVNFTQDWLVGINVTEVSEYVKDYAAEIKDPEPHQVNPTDTTQNK
ncbi:hypothetical protein [Flavobacterium sp.]|uniref:hypothetical protein n=1 Tax=Flavobacterium sp. TaxID=239 RepID=UPI0031D565AB